MSMFPTELDIDRALQIAQERFASRRPASASAHGIAAHFMPGGNTRTTLFNHPFPLRVTSAYGANLLDMDGLSYIDFVGGYGAGLFGANDPAIRAAINIALDKGIILSASNIYEIELSRLLCKRFSAIERVRFTNSGSEANLMAVATARAVTKRPKIMAFRGGYHAGTLAFDNSGPSALNAPFPHVLSTYNDVAGTATLIREHANELACIIVEPMLGPAGCIPASDEFLSVLREEAHATGALLIFDEVMTSRLAYGGMQTLFGIAPDLTVLGKYLGGGMSFGAFGGAAWIMQHYDPNQSFGLPHGGVFNNNVLSMAAGVAGLELYREPQVIELNGKGERLRDRLNKSFAMAEVDLQVTGMGSLMNLHATRHPISTPQDLQGKVQSKIKELIFLDLLEAGFVVAKNGFIALNLALTDTDIESFSQALCHIVEQRRTLLGAYM